MNLLRGEAGEVGGERYSINNGYEYDIEEWEKAGKPNGWRFNVGTTSDVMQALGAMENDIYIDGDKIKKILVEHPEVTMKQIK